MKILTAPELVDLLILRAGYTRAEASACMARPECQPTPSRLAIASLLNEFGTASARRGALTTYLAMIAPVVEKINEVDNYHAAANVGGAVIEEIAKVVNSETPGKIDPLS
jgi:hypothetical protein